MGICCSQGLCVNLEGWGGEGDGREVRRGGDISIPMADSCWGLTENSKILYNNYPSVKNILKGKRNGESVSTPSSWKQIIHTANDERPEALALQQTPRSDSVAAGVCSPPCSRGQSQLQSQTRRGGAPASTSGHRTPSAQAMQDSNRRVWLLRCRNTVTNVAPKAGGRPGKTTAPVPTLQAAGTKVPRRHPAPCQQDHHTQRSERTLAKWLAVISAAREKDAAHTHACHPPQVTASHTNTPAVRTPPFLPPVGGVNSQRTQYRLIPELKAPITIKSGSRRRQRWT